MGEILVADVEGRGASRNHFDINAFPFTTDTNCRP